MHFRAGAVRLDAAYRALGEEATYWQADSLAKRLNAFGPCSEPVRWWRSPKTRPGADGTVRHRIVCDLPLMLYASHLIIRNVLEQQFVPGDHIWDIKGRGRDKEAEAIQAAMEQGYRYAFVGDLTDAFPSVDPEALKTLPLPRAVIRRALDHRNLNYRHDLKRERRAQADAPPRMSPVSQEESTHGNMPGRNGPRGLLQGSPASNLILASLLNDLPGALPAGCKPFLLADDVLVLTHTDEECRRVETALSLYLEGHHAGPFALVTKFIGHIGTIGFDRAGYNYSLGPSFAAEIGIDFRNIEKMLAECQVAIERDAERGRMVSWQTVHMLQAKLSGFSAVSDPEPLVRLVFDHMFDELRLARMHRFEEV